MRQLCKQRLHSCLGTTTSLFWRKSKTTPISSNLLARIREISEMLNKAVHGKQLTPGVAERALGSGGQVLRELAKIADSNDG